MAGADYLKCEICGERIMYEPNADPEIKVVCMNCYSSVCVHDDDCMIQTHGSGCDGCITNDNYRKRRIL